MFASDFKRHTTMKFNSILPAALIGVAAVLIASCQKEEAQSSISIDPETIEAPYEGGTYQATVKASGSWTAIPDVDYITVTPNEGNGDTPVTVTVGQNPMEQQFTTNIVFECGTAEATMKVVHAGLVIPDPEIIVEPSSLEVPREGGEYELTVTSNYPWNAVTNSAYITLSTESGESSGTVTITVAANDTEEEQTAEIEFTCGYDDINRIGVTVTVTLEAGLPEGVIEYAGIQYRTAVMGDGRTWMTDNLRYIPEGMTVSSDPADGSGLWYPNLGGETALTDDESIQKYGYLYTPFVAMGITAGDVNADNYTSFEGIQGICPDGWHIPTEAEAQALVDAYYDEDQKGALISSLEEAGFNTVLGGFVQRNNSGATGKYSAAMPGYIICSTGSAYKVSEEGVITSSNRALMKTENNTYQRFTIALIQNYGGANVRCIKDAE